MNQKGKHELAVTWEDGHESVYPVRDLRLACPCARCIDEVTKAAILIPKDVPLDIQPNKIEPVGRYGIQIHWNDNHSTGILTFRNLRELCPCEACLRT
jgi:ATP-binding protein involved in chromosome partitioning